jgi:hypothetical protein
VGDKRALRRGESGGDAGRREKSYMTADTGDLGVTLLEDIYERRLPFISKISHRHTQGH